MRLRCRSASFLLCCSATVIFGCGPQQPQTPPDTRPADEAAIRKADNDWAKAAVSKQVDAWVAYYSNDAVVLPPNEKMATGGDAIRKSIGALFALPGMSIKWAPTKVEAARSGDIGYTWGTYELTANDPGGTPGTEHGKYVEIWKKQADGTWKCAVDTFNSDMPGGD